MRWVVAVLTGMSLATSPAAAQSASSVQSLLQQLKDAYEVARPNTRTVTITVGDLGESVKFVGRQARKQLADGKWVAMVMVAPASIKGTAFLIHEPTDKSKRAVVWTYAPTINRVRRLAPIEAYDHFMDTDFTFADLGFVRVHNQYTLIDEEERDGVKAFKIEEKIPAEQMYYGRVVTWVNAANHLPIAREYYDGANALWKTEHFDAATAIEGVPTVLHIQMKDVQAGTTTNLTVSDVRYDVPVPDSIFDPQQLGKLADHPFWNAPPGGK
jgi:hypothetical protein